MLTSSPPRERTKSFRDAGSRIFQQESDAQPGIIMLSDPHVGDRYRQELAPGVAEDMAKVLSLHKSKCVPYGCFDDVLLTKEWSPLKPGVVERKYYAEDVGLILAVMVKGGHERIELVQITSEDDED